MTIKRIRASDETWAFTSDMYARVNAGLVVTREGGILIDTLLFPVETRQLVNYTHRLCEAGIKYVINTQAAMDHSLGSFMFPEAELLAHRETPEIPGQQRGAQPAQGEGDQPGTPATPRSGCRAWCSTTAWCCGWTARRFRSFTRRDRPTTPAWSTCRRRRSCLPAT